MTDAPSPGSDQAQLLEFVEIWRQECADFVTLARSIEREQWDIPTDLDGWSVKDNVAHTAHLEGVLAGTPEETIEVSEAPHLKGLMNYYTEQGVLARRGRDMLQIAEEIENAVATRYAELQANPPVDGSAAPPRTPGGIGWNYQTLLRNRPFDVWMHEQDIRRAIGRPGGYDSPAAAHVLDVLSLGLPMVVGKRLAPPPGTTIRIDVPEAGTGWTVAVGEDGRAALTEGAGPPDVTVTLSPEDFVVLGGGRRGVADTDPEISGDEELGRRLLESLAVTP